MFRTAFLGSAGLGLGLIGNKIWAATQTSEAALSASEFRSMKLVDFTQESPDTRRFRFAFADPEMVSGLNTASCIVLKGQDSEGGTFVRPYTPISKNEQKGYMELVVKRYPNSKMGSYLFGMKKGDTIDAKGPFQKLEYVPNKWKHIGLIAGGTGITPVYQVLQEIMSNPADHTKVSLIYANRSEEDILLADELAKLSKHENVYTYHTVSTAKKGWIGGVGHISEDMIRNVMPAPGGKDSIVLVCGPPGMMEAVSGPKDFTASPPTQGELGGLLKKMNYSPKEVFKF